MTIQDLKDKGLILLQCLSGSKAYGLDTPESDTDIRGVFCLPKERFYGLDYIAQIADERNDEVYYELGRFVELLARNNPNILELLAAPAGAILHRHPVMDLLRPELVLSKLCRETFAGYAMTQIRKARGYNKKVVNPVGAARRPVTDFCYVVEGAGSRPLAGWLAEQGKVQERCGLSAVPHSKGLYALFYDSRGSLAYRGLVSGESANEVSLSSIPKGERPLAHLFFNQESYSSYCKSYGEYWDWVAKRNEVRYAGNLAHGKDYDAKNLMHTIRLLQVAEELLRTGRLNVQRPNREALLSIRRGDYEYEELLVMAEDLMRSVERAADTSPLPELPDRTALERVLIRMRDVLYDGQEPRAQF